MNELHIQRRMFDEDIALLKDRKGRYVPTPLWILAEVEGAGIQWLLREYGLQDYIGRPTEAQALRNLTTQANAVDFLVRLGGKQTMIALYQTVLRLERKYLKKAPKRTPHHEICAEVAIELSRLERSDYRARQVAELIKEATRVMQRLEQVGAALDYVAFRYALEHNAAQHEEEAALAA